MTAAVPANVTPFGSSRWRTGFSKKWKVKAASAVEADERHAERDHGGASSISSVR